MVIVLKLIKAIDLHYRDRKKNYTENDSLVLFFFPKKHVLTLNSKKLKISLILYY